MLRFLFHPLFLAGGVLGVLAVLAAEHVDRRTSTEAFCGTTCHSMQTFVAGEETYVNSVHRTTKSGVRAGCGDCHIPPGLVPATWAHVKGGVKDVYVETTNDFTDPAVWEARREALAHDVRDWLLANDSMTCRRCHEEAAIVPEKKRGQRQHEEAREKGMTCIACHYNLVHGEVEPTERFLRLSGGS